MRGLRLSKYYEEEEMQGKGKPARGMIKYTYVEYFLHFETGILRKEINTCGFFEPIALRMHFHFTSLR